MDVELVVLRGSASKNCNLLRSRSSTCPNDSNEDRDPEIRRKFVIEFYGNC